MGVLRPRTRTLGVRLSLEEFAALERVCVASNARSLSDVARSAICEFVNRVALDGEATRVKDKQIRQLKIMERKIESLSAELAAMKDKREAV